MSEVYDERILMFNLSNGDPQSFDIIYGRYNKRVYAFSLRCLKDKHNAESIVQDVFTTIWKDRKKLEKVENLSAWIFVICYNTIKKHYRRLLKEREYLKEFTHTTLLDDHSTESNIEYNDLLVKAQLIIERMPNRIKTIFLMSKQEGLSNDEISKKLGISKKTVENYITNSKLFITKAMKEQGLLSIFFYWLFIDQL